MPQVWYLVLAVAVGACFALQASANSKFRMNLGSPMWAAFFSICGTFITAVTAMVVLRPSSPAGDAIRETPWWNWIGGPLGTLIVLAGAYLTRSLGAAAFLSLMIAGQLVLSIALDHYGLLGLAVKEVTPRRLLGAVLVVAGVVCVKWEAADPQP